jgi:hypothetical protein
MFFALIGYQFHWRLWMRSACCKGAAMDITCLKCGHTDEYVHFIYLCKNG